MKKIFASLSTEISPSEQAHLDFVRDHSGEAMVLLENDGTLPLKTVGKIALYGNGARRTVKGGTGSGDVNSRFVVNVEQGLEAAGFTITTKNWLDGMDRAAENDYRGYEAMLNEESARTGMRAGLIAINKPFHPKATNPITDEDVVASDTDTAIYVLARNSGEGSDRFDEPGDYQLLQGEVENLKKLAGCYKKVIVLLNVGGIINAATIKEIPGISALMLISQSGSMGGHIVADVIQGKVVPSGHLADTWAEKYSDYPSSANFSHNNGDVNDEFYTDGIYVGYRYFDTFNITPLYPFGYGKSYTNFDIKTNRVEADETYVAVTITVTNTGNEYKGREVVQIYASAPISKIEKPYQVLAAFGKSKLLNPGESQTMTIRFPLTNLESYDSTMAAYVLEAGTYYIRVGANSRATKVVAALHLDKTAITKQVKNICKLDVDLEEITSMNVISYSYKGEETEKAAAPIILLRAARIPTKSVVYADEPTPLVAPKTDHVITMSDVDSGSYTLEQLVAQLTVEEMADLCVGAARNGTSIIGMGAVEVPGAAGDISINLKATRGIRRMTNADGPAGLRLASHFRVDADGIPLPMADPSGKGVDVLPAKEGETDYYRFCTAIPIASLMASSWDMEFIESIGNLVGSELEQFGIQIWLAPGMNIHRNPLCGRNFEYYSEDPLLSGLCAAATVCGVQKYPGVGTSIKHFFANSQEDNRMFINAHISERALREIYLRNFGIAIQASQPMTIMTSYNLINGVHAANSYDSITCFAREENGFAGYFMTDWYATNLQMCRLFTAYEPQYTCSSSPMCIYAGNDVQMPGCDTNVADIIDAINDGNLSIARLQQCCLRLLTVDRKCSGFEDAGSYTADLNLVSFVDVW